jgi:hypothetical protein
MLFKTNDRLEFKHPFKQHEGERLYPAFEVVLNVGLFHADLVVSHEDDTYDFRLISHDLDHVLRTIEEAPLSKSELFYQIARHRGDEDYRILKIKEICTMPKGIMFTFFNGDTYEDRMQSSANRGLIYKA